MNTFCSRDHSSVRSKPTLDLGLRAADLILFILTMHATLGTFWPRELAHAQLAAEASNSTDPRILAIGESLHIEASQLGASREIHISHGEVVRAKSLQDGIVLTGKKLGSAILRFGANQKPWRIWILPKAQARGAKKLVEQLKLWPNLHLETDALPQLIVGGELQDIGIWRELTLLARRMDYQWLMRAQISAEIRNEVESELRRDLAARGWSGLSFDLRSGGWTALLSPEQFKKTRAQERQILGHLGVELRVSSGVVGLEPMIRTQIRVTELRKSSMRRMGIRPPKALSFDLLPTLAPSTGPSGQLQAQIEFFEDQGEAKMLAAPTLLCRSGGRAQFFAGGEIPLRLVSERSAQVEWKRYGIGLEIQPVADAQGRLKIKLGTEISELDTSVSTDGLPGLTSHRVNTEFNLQRAGTLVLSGLFRRDRGNSRHGWPGLQSLPILGSLFSSRDFTQRESELVIFVSPEVITEDSASSPASGDSPNPEAPLLKMPRDRAKLATQHSRLRVRR
ncbi:MAG TPA: hypothetical protein PLZ57_05125 [Pseudobdellovibrionaceae bacterium]|nr:hypothetical protein [Pseudobdellovibrionaceae bacterium]